MRPDGDGSFSVTPDELSETASIFYKASSDTSDLQTSLTADANQLIADMSSVLDQSPASLHRFFDRWSTAVENLSNALESVGTNLYDASIGYQQADNDVKQAFQNHRHGMN